jgi:hypothetical protein
VGFGGLLASLADDLEGQIEVQAAGALESRVALLIQSIRRLRDKLLKERLIERFSFDDLDLAENANPSGRAGAAERIRRGIETIYQQRSSESTRPFSRRFLSAT